MVMFAQKVTYNNETWSSFAVATLPFPPKLVKFHAKNQEYPVKLYPDSYRSHN